MNYYLSWRRMIIHWIAYANSERSFCFSKSIWEIIFQEELVGIGSFFRVVLSETYNKLQMFFEKQGKIVRFAPFFKVFFLGRDEMIFGNDSLASWNSVNRKVRFSADKLFDWYILYGSNLLNFETGKIFLGCV